MIITMKAEAWAEVVKLKKRFQILKHLLLNRCRDCSSHDDCGGDMPFCYDGQCDSCQECHYCQDGIDGTCGPCGDGYPLYESTCGADGISSTTYNIFICKTSF